MKFARTTVLSVCTASLLGWASLSAASTIDQCRDLIGAPKDSGNPTGLYQKTQAAEFTSQNHPKRDQDGLLSKLEDADTKLNYAKFTQAEEKMVDYLSKVRDLAVPNRKGEYKLDPEDAAEMDADAGDIIICIQNIGSI